MTPSLRQLEYLIAVARTLNFRQAAESCHVSQPALSAQIQQLEATLGVTLFERDKRRVRLTAVGADLAERARSILGDVSDLVDAAQASKRPLAGTVRMGVIPTVAPYLLPFAVPIIAAAHPDLRLLLREDQTARLVEKLEAGDLDVLLLAVEVDLHGAEVEELFRDPFVFAARDDHPLLDEETIPLEALKDEPVLLLEDGHCLRDQALSFCEGAGVEELDDFRASSLTTLVQMVANGVGVTLLPALAIEVEVRAGRLGVCPFTAPAPYRTIGLAWRSSSPRRDEFLLLAEHLRKLEAGVRV